MAAEAEMGGQSRCGTGMVGLNSTAGDEHTRLLIQGLLNDEFKFSHLVAAPKHSGEIISFTPDEGSAQTRAPAAQCL